MKKGNLNLYHSSQILLLIAVLFSSCNSDQIFKGRYEIPEYGWAYADQAIFNFEIEDTTALYRMSVDIEHTEVYPFQNIYLKIHSRFPDDSTRVILHSIELQEPNGQWIGNCSGDDCGVRVILSENMYFNQIGTHSISFEQYTRRDSLPGIKQWDLILEKMGTKPTNPEPTDDQKPG